MIKRFLLSALAVFAVAAPAAAQLRPVAASTLRTTDTTANSLVVGAASGATTGTGGIKAGQVSVNGVGIIGTDGRIPAISSTYFASVSGANLTGIVETAITDGALLARVADTESVTGAWTFTNTAGLALTNAAPILKWTESGATANEGGWRMYADGDLFVFQTIADNGNPGANIFSVDRTGTTVAAMTVAASQVLLPTGTVGAPSLAFSADTDVGLMYDADGMAGGGTPSIAVVTAGVQSSWLSINGIQYNGVLAGSAGSISSTTAGVAFSGVSVGNTVATFNRTTNDGIIVDLQQDTTSEGSISVSGTTVSYNTFMGAHYTQLMPGQNAPESGTIVVSTGKTIPVMPRRLTQAVRMRTAEGLSLGEGTIDVGAAPVDPDAERFVYVEPSSRRNQRGVYGTWHADLGRTAAGMSWGNPNAEVYQVGGLGLTTVWVTDTCGPIEKGQLLSTSPVAGLAERQCADGGSGYDPVQRDYTLGKSLIDVDFSTVAPDANGVRKVRIPTVLFAG